MSLMIVFAVLGYAVFCGIGDVCGVGVDRAVVTTLAGGVSGTNPAFADGFGTNAGFNRPYGVAVDASGSVFVVDTRNYRIRKVTAGGGTRIGPVKRGGLSCWS
jgi:hypothetical protein